MVSSITCLSSILDFFGIIRPWQYGYNATWWFMTLILFFYILFPLLFWLIKRNWVAVLVLTFVFLIKDIQLFSGVIFVKYYLFDFCLGIVIPLKLEDALVKLKSILLNNKVVSLLILSVAVTYLIYVRGVNPIIGGIKIDFLLGLLTILLTLVLTKSKIFKNVASAFGKVSYEIFLFHSFIQGYYFRDFIYSFKNPFIILVVLSVICLLFGQLLQKVTNYLVAFSKLFGASCRNVPVVADGE